jgi:hypothetical protein
MNIPLACPCLGPEEAAVWTNERAARRLGAVLEMERPKKSPVLSHPEGVK